MEKSSQKGELMSEKINVGDIVKLTGEGQNYIARDFKGVTRRSVGLIVKKYLYEDGDDQNNNQDVYDILISGHVVQSLFDSEIMLTK